FSHPSLHDALPIWMPSSPRAARFSRSPTVSAASPSSAAPRSPASPNQPKSAQLAPSPSYRQWSVHGTAAAGALSTPCSPRFNLRLAALVLPDNHPTAAQFAVLRVSTCTYLCLLPISDVIGNLAEFGLRR